LLDSAKSGTPVPVDFDGDGLADPAVYASGAWHVWLSGSDYAYSGPHTFTPSTSGTPVPADYDGDRRADPAVYANNSWTVWLSAGGYGATGPHEFKIGADDYPLSGDFDGDGLADPAVISPGTAALYIWKSSNNYQQSGPYVLP
jgi:hypothetical protein